MMAFFSYLANITYYLLFAAVVNLLAPAGKYKKFVSLVTGFVLVVLIISPLRNVGQSLDVVEFFSSMMGMETRWQMPDGLYYAHNTVLVEAFNEQLEKQLSNYLARHGFAVWDAAFSVSDDFTMVTGVWVSVSAVPEARRVPFIRIEPVQINRNETPEVDPKMLEIKNLISDFYQLPATHIHVNISDR